jgi:cytochrome b561
MRISTVLDDRPEPGRYDRTTIALHWVVALMVPLQWAGAHTIDWFPKGPLRVDVRSLHIVGGALLAALLVYRLYWRRARGVHFARRAGATFETLAVAVHYALYALLATVLALGIFNAWLRGDDIFGLFHIPQFSSYSKDARHLFANQVVDWHRLASNGLLVLAAGHASVALVHHFWLKDAVLTRMLGKRSR